ncbi:MAG: TerB family tellurite resistance protein [Pseudomonadota bacterium]
MLSAIKRFFDINLAPGSPQEHRDPDHVVRVAVAALLIEVAASDYKQSPQERNVLLKSVHNHFGLSETEASALIKLAESEHAESIDYFQFTNLINQHYNPKQKIKVVEELWRVAFADKELHKYEEHVIRRLADLIHVSHKDFIAAKHRILKSS